MATYVRWVKHSSRSLNHYPGEMGPGKSPRTLCGRYIPHYMTAHVVWSNDRAYRRMCKQCDEKKREGDEGV